MEEVCVVNIGPIQRRRRRNLGFVALAGGAAWGLAVSVLALPSVVTLASSILFFAGFAGVLQARAKT